MTEPEKQAMQQAIQDQLDGMELQRNGALNDGVSLRAQLLAAQRRISELEARVGEPSVAPAHAPKPAIHANGHVEQVANT
jgi:hypothetical protein